MSRVVQGILFNASALMLGGIIVAFLALVLVMVCQKAAAPAPVPFRTTVQVRPLDTNMVDDPMETPGETALEFSEKAGSQ